MYIALYLLVCALYTTVPTEVHDQIDKNACLKPACIDAASEIQQYLDPSVQPCDDFYAFACGGFLQKNDIPVTKKGFDLFRNLSDTIDEQTKTVIEENTGDTSLNAIKLVKKLYDVCTNTAAIERDGIKSILYYINLFGGWSLLKSEGSNKNEEQDWIELTTKLRKTGFGDYLISVSVESDPRNDSEHILAIGHPHLVVRRDWREEEMEAYRNYLTNIAVALGANKDAADKEFQEFTIFALHLANIQGPEQERGMSIRELEFNYPGIPWLQFIKNVLNDDGEEVTYDDAVLVKSPQFILNLIQMLKYTSKRTLTNYLLSRAVTSMLPYSTNALRNEDLAFRKRLHDSTEYDPRWKECLHVVSGRLHVAIAAMYIRKYFSDSDFKVASEIADELQTEFRNALSDVKWMEKSSKEYAHKKLDEMEKYLGFPKELLVNNKIEEYYAALELDTNSYLQAIKQIDLFHVDKHYKQLRTPLGNNKWADQSHVNTIAAFYNTGRNALIFPAGLLQEPFYNAERPRYMNFGTLGTLIGHEIIHGFDNQGKHYDEDGGLENWWTPRTESNYAHATKCISHYYSGSNAEIGLNINHVNMHDEIIADLGGVKQAYNAYEVWLQHHHIPEPTLPGLNYTQNQLFWISAANIWCSKFLNTDGENYSPGAYRVYEAFRNIEQFSKDFDCPLGSSMNPEQKCVIW